MKNLTFPFYIIIILASHGQSSTVNALNAITAMEIGNCFDLRLSQVLQGLLCNINSASGLNRLLSKKPLQELRGAMCCYTHRQMPEYITHRDDNTKRTQIQCIPQPLHAYIFSSDMIPHGSPPRCKLHGPSAGAVTLVWAAIGDSIPLRHPLCHLQIQP